MASTQLFGRGWWTVEWSCICRLGGAIEGKANSQAAWVGIFTADEFQTTRATSQHDKADIEQQQEGKKN
ncbi:hypothetical protein QT982_35200 [Microcoleus sp. herbarium2]